MATPKNQSVLKAFAMLKAFHSPNEWLTSCELSRRAKLPAASGYRLIQTLVEIGAVVRGARGRYRPGMLLVSLSHNVAIGELLHEASEDLTNALATRVNATVHLGILEGGMVTYVSKASTPTSFPTHTRPGAQLEAYSSGLGKVLLAGLPYDQLESFIMDGDLVALTPYTITDRTVLLEQLERVRTLGFAVDDRESQADLRCVAVPVQDSDGRIVAALSASDYAPHMTAERQAELLEALLEAAASLGQKVYRTGAPIKHVDLHPGVLVPSNAAPAQDLV
jgi:DNA-binding IclR family transcriptional regulator